MDNNIICKEAFNKLKQDMEGVRSMHVSWIYDIWERCESAMLKRSNQKPALEYKVTPMFTEREHIAHVHEYSFVSPKFKLRKVTETVKYQQNSFSREELQLLKTVLTDEINKLQGKKKHSKYVIQYYWNYCDKEKQTSSNSHFLAMNAEKDRLRGLRKRYNNLAEIQRKIKKQLT